MKSTAKKLDHQLGTRLASLELKTFEWQFHSSSTSNFVRLTCSCNSHTIYICFGCKTTKPDSLPLNLFTTLSADFICFISIHQRVKMITLLYIHLLILFALLFVVILLLAEKHTHRCTLDSVIMPNFKAYQSESNDQKVMHTTFPAFKFPDRANLHIQCTLVICNTTCLKVLALIFFLHVAAFTQVLLNSFFNFTFILCLVCLVFFSFFLIFSILRFLLLFIHCNTRLCLTV